MYSSCLGDQYTGLGIQKHVSNCLFFHSYFNKIYIEEMINDSTQHLIILKWPIRQKIREKRKTKRC